MNWLKQAQELLRSACTSHGIRASLINKDNYDAIFTRDAVMSGIAGLLLKDEIIIEGFKQTLNQLKDSQGKQGQIASNFTIKAGEIEKLSFGTPSPKIDSCTWYLIGIGLLIKEGLIEKETYRTSVEQAIHLLEAIEYNGNHLMYIPKGGNWADEYPYEGYILYDQVLRAWGLSLLGNAYAVKAWSDKSAAILACIENQYRDDKSDYLNAGFSPDRVFTRFDLAAHSLLGIMLGEKHSFVKQSLEYIISEFLNKGKLPPAFYPTITEGDKDWEALRNYHLFDFKNKPHHYHNGGIWWAWLGWLSVALSLWNQQAALKKLHKLSFDHLNSLDRFDFDEYLAADDLQPNGAKQLCYTATGIALLSLSKNSFDFSTLRINEQGLIKESFEIKEEYFDLSKQLVKALAHKQLIGKDKLVIGICGESGSGKSVTAKCLQIELEKQNIPSITLHQDSYYLYTPKENHNKRKADLNWVGPNELRKDLLQSHIQQFKAHKESLTVPIVDYEKNVFLEDQITIKNKSVLIVEGVYSFLFDQLDFKIFMERNYKDTLSKRKERSREVYDPFVEQVLLIEHNIVKPLGASADVVIGRDYTLSAKSGKRI